MYNRTKNRERKNMQNHTIHKQELNEMLTRRVRFKSLWFGVCFFFPIFSTDLSLTSWILSVGTINIQTLLAFALGGLFSYNFSEKPNVWFPVETFDFRLIFKDDIKFWMSDRLCCSKNVFHTWKAAAFSLEGVLCGRPNYKRSRYTHHHSSAHSCSSLHPHT